MKRSPALLATILLTAALMAQAAAPARAEVIVHRNVIVKLTENNIRHFLEEVEQVANGNKPGMSPDEMATYFQNHVADDAKFTSTMHREMPGQPATDTTETVNKQQYIDGIVGVQGAMTDYDSTIELQDIAIASDGRSATLKTVTKEKGKLATQSQDGKPQPLIPFAGQSACDETIALSATDTIQMKSAVCRSGMKVDPWGGQSLTASP